MDYIDLHVHSTASDGSCSPSELVQMALEKGLFAFALTDHDTVSGVQEALDAAQGHPVNVIAGVEISSQYNGKEVHVLGYHVDIKNQFLIETLESIAALRYERNDKICELLRRQGVDITIEKLYENYSGQALTRGNLGRYLVDHGYVSSMSEAFEKYIGKHCPAYVPKFRLGLEDTYKLITYAGGVCSLAHPVQYKMLDNDYRRMFRDLRDLGFTCIEAIHSDNKPGDEAKFRAMAERYGLGITGGSDFHGRSKPDIAMGTGRGNVMVPKSILANIGINII